MLGVPSTASASAMARQDGAAGEASRPSVQRLVEDFVFFVTVAKYELAQANIRALLEMDIEATELAAIIGDAPGLAARFDEAYRRALVVPELEADAAALWKKYETGLDDRARSPQRISESIAMLDQGMRAEQLATQRLISAGEYAVPQLFDLLSGGQDLRMRARAQRMLERLGSDAVKPLLAALPASLPEVQERIAIILGQVGNPLALPALYELANAEGTAPTVRSEAQNAIRAITGTYDASVRSSVLYQTQARSYFDGRRRVVGGLLSFPGEDFQLIWNFTPEVGLTPLPIETVVYHETMAMQMAERALSQDASNGDALAVWIAANFARELSESGETPNPLYDSEDRDAVFFATLAGAGSTQRALDLALEDGDTQLVRALIAALDSSIGGAGLVEGESAQTPLVRALTYPDRMVRFEAALALARSMPERGFIGAERVVPTLAGFIRESGVRYALVLAEDVDRQQFLRAALESEGFTVLPPTRSLNDAMSDVAATPGVDIAVIDLPGEVGVAASEALRGEPSLRATPALVFLSLEDQVRFNNRLSGDVISTMVRPGLSESQLAAAAVQAVGSASGEVLSDEAAEDAALEAIEALRRLAIGRSSALSINDAGTALIAALNESSGLIRLELADVLGYICESRAQTALLDAALQSEGNEQVLLLNTAAASARRCGPLSEDRQIEALADLLLVGDLESARAAAEVLGALRAAGEQAVPVILGR
ncbi:MAG: HEAT repeat domain-containing protein [Phycisphaerales bacterium]